MSVRSFFHSKAPLLVWAVVGLAQAAPNPTHAVSKLVDRSEGLYAHDAIVERPNAAPLRLNWVDRLSEIRATSLYDAKLLALGVIDGAAEGFSVVAAYGDQREPEGFVLCREPLVSPSGRFVSYLQFVPRQAPVESLRDLVLIYDLQHPGPGIGGVTADEGWVSLAANRGVVVYPGPPRSQRVFPVALGVRSGVGPEIKARSWARDRDLQFIVAVEGTELAVLAVDVAPEGGYRVRQARAGAQQTFGPASKMTWSTARVLSVAPSGVNSVLLTFDASSGVPGGHLQLALR